MKISSKSILSPGRTDKFRDPTAAAAPVSSLSASLSRRFRTNGSLRSSGSGQASPMFPKKRGGGGGGGGGGAGFENPEPSSPKVTCIGQVRVKTKKKKAQARKKNQQLRSRSQRRGGGGGEVSFRRIDRGNRSQQERNGNSQRWVHLPLTICEALRAFGAEFNCFLPCRSSCASEKEKAGAGEDSLSRGRGGVEGSGDVGSSSCGAAITRWLVAIQDGEGGGKGREIELVVEEEGGGETDEEDAIRRCRRRLGIEDMEAAARGEERDAVVGATGEEEVASVCVPPKNALLLMRCRSDPVRMSALANRLWESSVNKDGDEDEDEDDDNNGGERHNVEKERIGECEKVEAKSELELNLDAGEDQEESGELVSDEIEVQDRNNSNELVVVMEEEEGVDDEEPEAITNPLTCTAMDEAEAGKDESVEEVEAGVEVEVEVEESRTTTIQAAASAEESNVVTTVSEANVNDDEKFLDVEDDVSDDPTGKDEDVEEEEENEEMGHDDEEENEETATVSVRSEEEEETAYVSVSETEVVALGDKKEEKVTATEAVLEEESEESSKGEEEEETPDSHECDTEPESPKKTESEDGEEQQQEAEQIHQNSSQNAAKETESERWLSKNANAERDENSSSVLPNSLLLMMREPKLSMEVSKETWVCKKDFIRCLPQRRVNPIDGRDEPQKKRHSVDSNRPPRRHPHPLQPPRSSCSLPAAASMAAMIEQRLVCAAAYEPLVLTRCKSEPVRSAAKLAAPDACFWKTRKLEAAPQHHHPAAGVGF